MVQDGTGWFGTSRYLTDRVGTGQIGMERDKEERNGAESRNWAEEWNGTEKGGTRAEERDGTQWHKTVGAVWNGSELEIAIPGLGSWDPGGISIPIPIPKFRQSRDPENGYDLTKIANMAQVINTT